MHDRVHCHLTVVLRVDHFSVVKKVVVALSLLCTVSCLFFGTIVLSVEVLFSIYEGNFVRIPWQMMCMVSALLYCWAIM